LKIPNKKKNKKLKNFGIFGILEKKVSRTKIEK